MPYRITPLVTGQIYHIFNRGTEKRRIFENQRDYSRFIKTLSYYLLEGPKPKFSHFTEKHFSKVDPSRKIAELLSYCLMPNHFHLLLTQLKDSGITEVITKLSLSYTKYYNIKNSRLVPFFRDSLRQC